MVTSMYPRLSGTTKELGSFGRRTGSGWDIIIAPLPALADFGFFVLCQTRAFDLLLTLTFLPGDHEKFM